MQNKTDFYDILKITRTASQDEIKKSFRKLAMEFHPDKNNGDKDREDIFKHINEAYNILSDVEKRKQYDQFGIIDGQSQGQTVDLNDILKMFSGLGGGLGGLGGHKMQGPGGFSYVFTDGENNMSENIFESFSFDNMHNMHKKKKNEADIVDIQIDICDIYYGNNKKIEFDLLTQCEKCNGTGAYDQSHVIKCIACGGNGHITQQMGPFFMQKLACPSCMGKGNIIKKICTSCKGEKTVYSKNMFELKIPKGIPNNHEIKMEKKGSFNQVSKQVKDMIFKFKYKIDSPYTIDDQMNVIYTLNISIEDLLGGFKKNLILYKDSITIVSDRYFNPTNPYIVKEKGLYNIKRQKYNDLFLKFNIEFVNSDRLSKYNEVLQKVLKKQQTLQTEGSTIINIQDL